MALIAGMMKCIASDSTNKPGIFSILISAEAAWKAIAFRLRVQDSSGTNGSNFAIPADGNRPRLQAFIWTSPTPDRDGALDSQVFTHELTHGVSLRLHGNSTGLNSNMAAGMGEGWSDFYALALLSEPTDDPLGTYAVWGI
jgi:hypothetical protein